MTHSEVKNVQNIFKNGERNTTPEAYTSIWIRLINQIENHRKEKSPKAW